MDGWPIESPFRWANLFWRLFDKNLPNTTIIAVGFKTDTVLHEKWSDPDIQWGRDCACGCHLICFDSSIIGWELRPPDNIWKYEETLFDSLDEQVRSSCLRLMMRRLNAKSGKSTSQEDLSRWQSQELPHSDPLCHHFSPFSPLFCPPCAA